MRIAAWISNVRSCKKLFAEVLSGTQLRAPSRMTSPFFFGVDLWKRPTLLNYSASG